ncbi:MAG TPA: hypothetical protein VFK79_18065, partial [Xanthobacteraceae bacterium]|nr:hypothetical protein [Xanthobacteraceae bacterium]
GFNQFAGVAFSGANVVPPAPLAGTAIVTIQITIANVFSKNAATPSGCDATYTGRLAKRP